MTIATIFVSSCGKTNTETTTTAATVTPEEKMSPAERAANEVLKRFYNEPEKKDEGVYEENEYGISMTYEYDKNRNLVKVTYDGTVVTLEYDENGRVTKGSAKNAEEKNIATYAMTYTDSGLISEMITEFSEDDTRYSRKESFVYDEKNRLIKDEIVQSDEIVQQFEITYDEEARVITMTGHREYSTGKTTTVTAYNEDWKAIKAERFNENGTLVYVVEYDGNDNETKSISYDASGKVVYGYGYEYDEDGKKTKRLSYDENGEIKSYTTYEYDEKGNLIKEENFDAAGALQEYYVYECDEDGYILKETRYDANGVKRSCTEYFENTTNENKYFGSKQRRSESYDSDGSLSGITEYNRNGDIVKSEQYISGKLYGIEEREYDESGNLIKSSSYDADRKFTGYSVYGYNESGKRIKISKYDGSGTLTGYTEIKRNGDYILSETVYDGDGNKTEYTEYLENTSDYTKYSRRKRYEKYENGKLAELTEYNEKGERTKRISYDGEGNKREYTEYITLKVKHNGYEGTTIDIKTDEIYNNGKLERRTEYEYDENGNRTKILGYDGNGKLTEYTETKYDGEYVLFETVYDGEGNKTEYTEYLENTRRYEIYSRKKRYEKYENGKLAELKEYNENGKTLKRSSYKNGSLESYSSYHYNESGTLIKVTDCDASDRIVNYYEFEYTDEIGNGKTYMYDKDGTLVRTYDWVIFW